MRTTDRAYELMIDKIKQIECYTNIGLYNPENDQQKALHEIKTLLYDLQQIIRENFIVDGDLPPAA